MTKFAVIKTGGKQYKVSAGTKLKIEKLDAEIGSNINFDKVMLVASKDKAEEIGTPYISGAAVEAMVLRQSKHEKKIVFKYHSKTNYRKLKGHRQPYTEVEITKI